MKNNLTIIGMVMAVFIGSSGQAYAEGSWWDKGADIFKSLTKKSEKIAVAEPSYAEIGAAFKQALSIASENVVTQLGVNDGFNTDPSIHIPIPDGLTKVKKILSKVGMSDSVDDLELKLNRAAESATPKAKALFLQAINDMSFDDIKQIYQGPEDSATKYFQKKMSPSLIKEMQPIVDSTLSEVGAIQAYDTVIGQYKKLPFVPDVKADLTGYVLEKGMDGIFFYMAIEEAAIRKDPVKQTTELLKKVFTAKK